MNETRRGRRRRAGKNSSKQAHCRRTVLSTSQVPAQCWASTTRRRTGLVDFHPSSCFFRTNSGVWLMYLRVYVEQLIARWQRGTLCDLRPIETIRRGSLPCLHGLKPVGRCCLRRRVADGNRRRFDARSHRCRHRSQPLHTCLAAPCRSSMGRHRARVDKRSRRDKNTTISPFATPDRTYISAICVISTRLSSRTWS